MEDDAPEGGITQQRERCPAMPVEVGVLIQQGDEPVNTRELDESVDGSIGEACGQRTKREADSDFGTEPIAPHLFVRLKIAGE